MRERIRRPEFFAFYDYTAIQGRVEEMAAKGWLLEKPGNFLWTYRRVPARRLHAAVTYFPAASAFDPGPSQGELTMEEFCAQDGWRLLARWGQMQIFISGAEDPVPIETDPVTQVETIHRSMKRAMLPGHLLLAAVILWQIFFQFLQFRQDPVGYLAGASSLLMLPMWLLLLLATLHEVGFYFRWHHKAVRAAEDGVFLPIRTNRLLSALLLGGAVLLLLFSGIGSRSRLGILLGWCALYGVILFLTSRVRDVMKRRGSPRWATRLGTMGAAVGLTLLATSGMTAAIISGDLWRERSPAETYEFSGHTFSVYHDALPLAVADLTEPGDVRYSTEARREETFLLARTRYSQDALLGEGPGHPELDYTVVEVKAPFLYGLCRRSMEKEDPLFETEYRPADAGPWGAKEAFRMYRRGEADDRYLLLWEDRLAEVRLTGLPLTPQRMAVVGEKLKSADPGTSRR